MRGPNDPVETLDSAGQPRRGIQVRVVDDDDLDVAANTVGEIVLRSDNPWGAAQGYYKMPEALIAHCAGNLAYFMVPRFVEFVPEFPRTLTAKIEKHRLRAEAEQDLGKFWDRDKAGIILRR